LPTQSTPRPARIRFGPFELDPSSGELLKRGVRVRLHDKPYQLLMALLERPGETVSRKELEERLWPGGTFVEFENGINNAVSRLRDVLGDSAENPRFIETLPRRGYRFIAPVDVPALEVPAAPAPVAEVAPPPPVDDVAAPDPSSRPVQRSLRMAFVAAVLVALVMGVVAAVWLSRPGGAHQSVAVLPFIAGSDATAESPDEYLAFGMTDALTGELSRASALKVISQTSAMQYKGARKTLPEIARELGVGTVVEGSVVREGQQVRITVQLIDARTDTHLWTETYTRDAGTALSTQRALAREVASLIRSRLAVTDSPAVPVLQRTTPAAYEAYVKGRFIMQQPSDASLDRARELFEQAVAADPDFALAHVGLASYYLATDAVAPAEAMPRARASAARALVLDDAAAEAHASLAFVHYFGDWDWSATERAFSRAIGLDPNDARTRRWHALYQSAMGRHATATEEIQRALELDPISISALDAAGAVWSNARRFDKVLEQAARIRELSPQDPRGFLHQAVAYFHLNRFGEAADAAQQGVDASGRNPAFLSVLAVAQHRAGRTDQAAQTLAEIDRQAASGYVPDAFLALAYLWLRDHGAALDRLQRAYERRDTYLVVAKVAPWFDPLRDEPRFQDLLRRMNFPH
jgi:TolB-like protein/DNA-binding winged helix-turn-helix (wHTH) protein/tetratricopeptide (TPR) repeat protein